MNLAMLRMAKDGGKGKGKKGFGVRDEPKKGLLRAAFFARTDYITIKKRLADFGRFAKWGGGRGF